MKDTLLKWRIEEYEILAETQNQVKVRVKPLYPVTSRNGRKYTFDEMLESARTMNGKLINVNHNDGRKIGNVDWAKANRQTQFMEVEGTVNKEPYTYMVKNHDPKIKGWSVQADFRQAQCIHCSKKFDTMETLKEHLLKEEHISNIEFEPKDIVFNGLALVVDPEVPGIPNTSYMAETVGTRMFGSLQEMVNQLEAEDSWLLNKFGNRSERNMSKNYAIENKGSPVAPTSKTYSKEELQKVTMPETPLTPIKNIADLGIPETPAPNITLEKVTLKEAAAIGKLVYEEETCTPFEQCIKDGGTPEECAAKFKETAQRNNTNKAITDTVNEIIDWLSKPVVMEVAKDDLSWQSKIDTLQTQLNALPKDDLGWKEIKPYDDSSMGKAIEMLKQTVGIINDTTEKEHKESLESIKTLTENLAQTTQKITLIETEQLKVKETFEKLLDKADKNIVETRKTLEERIETLKKENKTLQETVETQAKTIKETAVRTDNLEDKQKPSFKGATSKGLTPKPPEDPVVGNPMDTHRRVS